jgi:hypothetical protein
MNTSPLKIIMDSYLSHIHTQLWARSVSCLIGTGVKTQGVKPTSRSDLYLLLQS